MSGEAHEASVSHLAATLLRRACERGVRISVAESCTGGLIATLLTGQEGVSHAFDRGFVVYDEHAKREVLGVAPETLRLEGAVSEVCAREMAAGALAGSRSQLAAAVTGFAGTAPPGQSPGLVHIAVAASGGPMLHRCFVFEEDDRARIRLAAARQTLLLLLNALEEWAEGDDPAPPASPW